MHNNRRKRSNSADSAGSPEGKTRQDDNKMRKGSLGLEVFVPDSKKDKYQLFNDFIHRLLFPNLPEQYPFRKKLQISKNTTRVGLVYDLCQDFCSVLMCGVFVASTYYKSYAAVHTIYYMDISISMFVLVDVLFNLYLLGKTFLLDIRCLVDLLSVFPTFFITVFVILLGQKLSFFYTQLISTLRLIRVIRIFKTLRFYHSMWKAVLKLAMTFSCLIFICSGLFQFFENDVPQKDYECQYINADTNWQPSCSDVMAASDMGACDCEMYQCEALYDLSDSRNEPSQIRCQLLDFNDAIYFVVITVTLVGYGSNVFSFYSKVVLVALIILALITIPPQLNDVEKYMTAKTSYRNPYQPSAGDYHVIVCGHVNDKKKLSAFLKEFLHPDRMFSSSPQFHVVIMSTVEPSDDVLELLHSEFLEGRITYCMGSALVQKDLERVRVDLAFGMFFLCNTELDASSEVSEDTATVMRALSVSNFNPTTECFVQVLKADERKILKESDVDVILCLDEYKITLQAKNSICPGFSTMIENLFHSFGGISSAIESELDPWYHEYLHGARMELYYVPLDQTFMKYIDYNFSILAEVIYTGWNLTIMGVCTETQDEVAFNPISKKTKKSKRFENLEDFYQHFNTGVIIADDNLQAEEVSKGLADSSRYKNILKKMKVAEVNFPVRLGNTESHPVVKPVKHTSIRSALFLKSFTRARDSLSKKLVNSPPKEEMNKELASDVQKVFSENYDSDESMDESSYIGYASTREQELKAAQAALSKTGYSDDGDKGFGRTTMVYTRHRTGLDVHAHAPGESKSVLNVQVAMEKKKNLALQTFSSKAMARGRKLSMALNLRRKGPSLASSTTSSAPTPHEVVSNTVTGEVRQTFTLTPSQIMANSNKLEKFDEEDEDEDEEDENRDGFESPVQNKSTRDKIDNSRLSVVSISSGTFPIGEGEDDDENSLSDHDVSAGEEEEKEERSTPPLLKNIPKLSADFVPVSNQASNNKVKHQTWGTLRESVVANSPSQMLKNAATSSTDHSHSDDDSDETTPPRQAHNSKLSGVVVDVMKQGKKITNVQISDVIKGKEKKLQGKQDLDREKEHARAPSPSRPPSRSILRKNVPMNGSSANTILNTTATNSHVTVVGKEESESEEGAQGKAKTKNVVPSSPSQMLQNANALEEDEDENSPSPSPAILVSSPPIAATRKSIIQFSPSQMLKKQGDAVEENNADDKDDEEEAEEEGKAKSHEERKKNSPSPPPSVHLSNGCNDNDNNHNHNQDNINNSNADGSSPRSKASLPSKAPRRSVLRKNLSSDNVVLTTSANSASVALKIAPLRKKLPPLAASGGNMDSKSTAKKKVFRGKVASVGPESPPEDESAKVKGPPRDLISQNITNKKKKKFRMKKMMLKFSRSSRVAVQCDPGAMSPNFDAVISQLKTLQTPPPTTNAVLASILPSFTPPTKKELIKSSFKRNFIRASILQKQRNDADKGIVPEAPSLSPPAEEPVRKKSAYGGLAAVVKKAILSTHPDSRGGLYGRKSEQVNDAQFLSNHIVIFGNVDVSHIFISELRRHTVRDEAYHPILLVDIEKPKSWDNIILQYNDVYFLPGSLLRSRGFSKSNIEKAFAVILLNMRSELNLNENIDSQTLFSYLKLEQYIPRNVFFSVELSNPANMSVLNATLMRRVRTHGNADSRICLRSHLETIADVNVNNNQTVSSSGLVDTCNLTPTSGQPPKSSYGTTTQTLAQKSLAPPHHQIHTPTAPKQQQYVPSTLGSSPLGVSVKLEEGSISDKYPAISSPDGQRPTGIAHAVSVSKMVMLSSGSSSSSEEDEGNDSNKVEDEDELRKKNIAEFRAKMRQVRQENEMKTGGFSARKSTRHTLVRNPDSIPKGARGSVSRVHTRSTMVQNRKSISNFRAPDISDSNSGEDEEEEDRKQELRKEIVNNDDDFWNATDTHHMLPVFAAARAYVPSSFESLLVQSFFGVLTPMMCEIFVCGQSGQSVVQILVPEKLFGRTFLDMFRIFSYHQVLCIGLYRAPNDDTMSTLPYVYLSPPKTAVLNFEDRVFLYGKPTRIARAVTACKNNNWR